MVYVAHVHEADFCWSVCRKQRIEIVFDVFEPHIKDAAKRRNLTDESASDSATPQVGQLMLGMKLCMLCALGVLKLL